MAMRMIPALAMLLMAASPAGAAQADSSEAAQEAKGVRTVGNALTTLPARGKAHGLAGNPGAWFGAGDYPAEALRARQEGRVVVRLSVDVTGHVASCALVVSSGSPSLDKATCDLAMARAVFTPATDADGRAITGTWTLPVNWVLPVAPLQIGSPAPVGDIAQWFGPDSYPAEALRLGQQGRVVVLLEIDVTGTPTSCSVQTGAAPALDRGTCDIALAHVRFNPAKDATGKPMVFTYRLPVRWVMPGGDAFRSHANTLIVGLGADGTVGSCKTASVGPDGNGPNVAECPLAETLTVPTIPRAALGPHAGKPVTVSMREALTIDGTQPVGVPAPKPGHYVAARERAHVTVGPDGKVTACRIIEKTGMLPTGDICAEPDSYEAVADGSAPRAGVIEMSMEVDPVDPPK